MKITSKYALSTATLVTLVIGAGAYLFTACLASMRCRVPRIHPTPINLSAEFIFVCLKRSLLSVGKCRIRLLFLF